jgi:hypothetical protein
LQLPDECWCLIFLSGSLIMNLRLPIQVLKLAAFPTFVNDLQNNSLEKETWWKRTSSSNQS